MEIQSIVDQVKQATDFQINKRLLKEKVKTDLSVPYNNGMFSISKELIAFVSIWPEDQLFLEDVFENPILINKTEFLELAIQHYQKVMNSWHQQHEELKQIRKI